MVYTRIIAAYDGSNEANQALDKAIELVKMKPGTSLEVIHAFDYPRSYVAVWPIINIDFYELAEKTVHEVERRIKEAGINGKVEAIKGQATDVIVEYSKKANNSLIIMGSRGNKGIRKYVLGSVSQYVCQHAKVPVMVVK